MEAYPNGNATRTKKWEDTEEDLGRDPFNELFSHIRMVYRKAKPQGTLITEFSEHVLRDINSLQFIDEVLMPMAAAYEELTDAAYVSVERAERVDGSLVGMIVAPAELARSSRRGV